MAASLRSALADALEHARIGVLVGLPATATIFLAVVVLLETAGWTRVTSSAFALGGLFICSMAVGLQLAVEVAAVRADGIEALGRGSRPAAVARYLVFASCVGATVLLLLAVTAVGLTAARRLLRGDSVEPGLLVGLAAAYVLYRGAMEFVDGLRRSDS